MKKILFTVLLACTNLLSAQENPALPEQKVDFFNLTCSAYAVAYSKAMEICNEKGYKFFKLKKFLYKDESGQTMEVIGTCKDNRGDFIEGVINDELKELGNITVHYEIICYRDPPKDDLASSVESYYQMINFFQNQAPEKVESSQVIEVNSMEELKKELNTSKTVYVDCYSNSCPPCKILSSRYDQYSKDLCSAGKFLKVNLENVQEVASSYQVRAMPTLLIFEKGELREAKVGLPDIATYFESLKQQ